MLRELDIIDRRILYYLQKQGRISYVELSKKIGLSKTPCMERVKRLENDKVIQGYAAQLNPELLQVGVLIFAEVSLITKSAKILENFKKTVLNNQNVLECHLVSGDFDYLIKARVPEVASYREILERLWANFPEVREHKSYVVIEKVKETNELPIFYDKDY